MEPLLKISSSNTNLLSYTLKESILGSLSRTSQLDSILMQSERQWTNFYRTFRRFRSHLLTTTSPLIRKEWLSLRMVWSSSFQMNTDHTSIRLKIRLVISSQPPLPSCYLTCKCPRTDLDTLPLLLFASASCANWYLNLIMLSPFYLTQRWLKESLTSPQKSIQTPASRFQVSSHQLQLPLISSFPSLHLLLLFPSFTNRKSRQPRFRRIDFG